MQTPKFLPKLKTPRLLFWLLIGLGLLFSAVQFGWPGQPPPAPLAITELVAANRTLLPDEDGDFSDWLEIHNPGPHPVNLAGWSLTDDPTQPQKWTFPDRTLPAQTYLVVFASGKNRRPAAPDQPLHTNFKLNQTGEFLALYNILDQQFASLEFPAQFSDVAYGRHPQAGYGYLAQATPGRPNPAKLRWAGVLPAVTFSVQRGFYPAPFRLELSNPVPGATLRYTTDGSAPTETHGQLYHGPLLVEQSGPVRAIAYKPHFRPAPVATHSYIFVDELLTQPAQPAGYPRQWGLEPGSRFPADYEMDPTIVTDPRYRPELAAALQAIPSLALTTGVENLDIYHYPEGRGRAWERPASVEFLYPDRPEANQQTNTGLRIQGNLARRQQIPKRSFRLFFKGQYGATKLEHPLFPGSAVTRFDTVTLRAGMDRSYVSNLNDDPFYAHNLVAYTRDEWLRRSQIAMSGVGSHGIFVHLYLNGLYWGLYNVVERPDASFAAAHLGGEKEEWFAVNHSGPISGDGERFDKLMELARAGGLADPERYALIQEYLDVEHFIDYILLNAYSGNQDWAENNWYATVRNPDGQVRYFVWDGELTWLDGAEFRKFPEGAAIDLDVLILFRVLLESPEFQMSFADRAYSQLFNGGALSEEQAQARWLAVNRPVAQAIVSESARWGDVRLEPPLTPADWRGARANVLAQMEGNSAKLIRLLRRAGYYPPIDPPRFEPAGGLVEPRFKVSMTAAEGEIYYTTTGADPRQPVSGDLASEARLYTGPLTLTAPVQLKARLRQGETWSALAQASFSPVSANGGLQVSEIMYNPPGSNDYEFIELKNIGTQPAVLAGLRFEGIEYTFPANTPPLPPGQRVTLVSDAPAFAARYPAASFGGVYRGHLANQGETIRLLDPQGRVVVALTYDDENGWPLSADGRGDSLVRIDPGGDPNDPQSWRASPTLHGSPGRENIDPRLP